MCICEEGRGVCTCVEREVPSHIYMRKKHLSVLDHGGGLNWRTATNTGSRTGMRLGQTGAVLLFVQSKGPQDS